MSTSPFVETTGSARHAAFAALAAGGAVQRTQLFTGAWAWVVTGYAEARELLAHPDVVKEYEGGPHPDVVPPGLRAATARHLLTHNPPDHTRLRRLVSCAFTVRRTAALAPRIQAITDALLDAMSDAAGPVDLVDAFARPLPITVITELLGVPEPRRAEFARWSAVLVGGSAYSAQEYLDGAGRMVDHVRELVASKRAEPADDLLSALVAVRDEGDRLSEDELSSMVVLLLIAGHETTVNLIANGTYALLTHPAQLALLRAEPERLPAAIEEMLRFDGPLQSAIPALTRAPVRVGGVTIPAGEMIVIALGAANRDRRQFADAMRFDITRAPAPHLAFGHGVHHCLGAPLARLEGRIALAALLDRFPGLRLAKPDVEPLRPFSLLMNGLVELPVRVDNVH